MVNKSVAVIIVNWNGEEFLGRCLDALMAQSVTPFEIIVVDNASSDGSVDILKRFPSVRLIELDQNTGFARGNNLAIEAVSNEVEWIALLNPDAFASPYWLEEMLETASCHPEFDVFGSKLLKASDSQVLDGVGDIYHLRGLVWRNGHGLSELLVGEKAEEQEIFSPCAAAALYRRDALLKVGGFDEDFFCYTEDVDLGFRLRLRGYRCMYVPKSIVYHVGSGTTGSQHSEFAIYHGHRNLVWTFIKNMPGWLFWLCLPVHIAMNIVSIFWFAYRGLGRVVVKAKWDALLGVSSMWRKRQKIQQQRDVSIRTIWHLLDKRLIPVRYK